MNNLEIHHPKKRVDAKYAALLRQIYNDHFPIANRPQVLWHYTTAEKFLKIIESGELWFTHVSCLNDTNEVQLAAEITKRAIARLEARFADSQDHGIVDRLANYAKSTLLDNNTQSEWFVSSFSESDDDLNQWQKYAGAMGGVAIGFNSEDLEKSFASDEMKGASIWRAIYDVPKLDRFADSICDLTLHIYKEFLAANEAVTQNPNELTTRFLEFWGPIVDELSVVAKSSAFSSEREWRLTIHEEDFEPEDLRFLARVTTISRHVRVKPKNRASDGGPVLLPISRVRLGPSGRPEVTTASIFSLLKKHGYEHVNLGRSRLPFQIV